MYYKIQTYIDAKILYSREFTLNPRDYIKFNTIDEIKENIVGTILHVDLDHTLNTAGRLLSINSYNVELPDYFVTEWKSLKNENTK
jgi:hypothetical protein